MKVRVKEEFRDKYTNELYKVGERLDLSVNRINEINSVGNLIDLEPDQFEAGQIEQSEQSESVHEQEIPKQSGRRKRIGKKED